MTAEAGRPAVTGSLRKMLVPLALAQFICSFAGSNMNVMINDIKTDLHTTVQGVQVCITLFLHHLGRRSRRPQTVLRGRHDRAGLHRPDRPVGYRLAPQGRTRTRDRCAQPGCRAPYLNKPYLQAGRTAREA
jgi:hypothetical protein